MGISAVSLEKALEIYLNGGVLKQVESEEDVFLPEADLLRLGYEKNGDLPEHTLFEKWHKTGRHKEINFKCYFFMGKPRASGLAFWNHRLSTVLKLAKPHVRRVEVLFNDDLDCGALVVNDFCLMRFGFDGNKHPKITTLETDKGIGETGLFPKIATGWARAQFSKVNSPKDVANNENAERIFNILAKNRILSSVI